MKKLPIAGPTYDYKLENIRNSIIEEELALTHRKLENIELGDGDVIFTDDSGNQKTVRTLQTTIDDPSTGLSATASAVSTLSTNVSTLDGEVTSLSSSVTSLSTTVGSNTTSISTNASSINGIEGKYAVKVNNNGHVSGFGLISTANNATPTSTFTVAADAFKIVDTSGSATPAAPFEVYTSSRTVDGVTVPAGVYMENANITSAQIKTLNADVIAAGTINADRLSVDGVTLDTSGGNLIVKTGGVDTAQIASNAVSSGISSYGGSAVDITSTLAQGGDDIASYTISATAGDKFYIQSSIAWFALSGTSGWGSGDSFNLRTYIGTTQWSQSSFHNPRTAGSTVIYNGVSYGGVFTASTTGNQTIKINGYNSQSNTTTSCRTVWLHIVKLER